MATKQGRILWVDAALDRLVVRPNEVDGRSMLVSVDDDGGQHAGGVYLPTAPSDCDRLLTDLAAEMGREPCEGGFRAKPEPPSLDLWVHRNLMPHITTHRRYNALTTEEVVAEAFRVATTDPAAFAEFVTFLPLLSFTPAEEPVDFAVPAGWSA